MWGEKGNFPPHELPLCILELPSRAGCEVRISVCSFPSGAPLSLSLGPSQHLLWGSHQEEARASLSSQTFASRKAGGRLGVSSGRTGHGPSQNSHSSPLPPVLTWGDVTCTAASALPPHVGPPCVNRGAYCRRDTKVHESTCCS